MDGKSSDYIKAQKWLERYEWEHDPEADDNLATICQALQDADRLAEFEEIFCSKMTDAACSLLKDKEEFAKWIERNKWIAKKCDEYARAEEQGKLLKLPCSVGDTVYAFHMDEIIDLKVIKISWFIMNGENIINVECLNTDCDCFRNFSREEFGKTVFLTLKEAEAALNVLNC